MEIFGIRMHAYTHMCKLQTFNVNIFNVTHPHTPKNKIKRKKQIYFTIAIEQQHQQQLHKHTYPPGIIQQKKSISK